MLAALGHHATTASLVALAAGMALPDLAAHARDALGPAVMVVVAASILARRVAPRQRGDRWLIAAFVLSATLLGPLAGAMLARAMRLPEEEIAWFVLATAAPIAIASGAVGRSMGLPDRASTLAALGSMLASPLTVPLAIALTVGEEAPGLDASVLVRNLALFVLLPALAAMALRRLHPGVAARHAAACAGLAVLGLAVQAFARGEALGPALLHDTASLLRAIGLAAMAGLLSGSLVALAALGFGRREAAEGGVAGTMRNVPLVWGALSERLPPAGELFLAAMVVPFHLMPWIATRAIATWRAAAGPSRAARPARISAPGSAGRRGTGGRYRRWAPSASSAPAPR